MIQAGTLNDRLMLQRHDTATDSWQPLEEHPVVWTAAVSTGDEQFDFTIRYRADLVDYEATQPAMRVIYRGRILEVINVVAVDRGELRVTARGHRVVVGDLGSTARQTTIWP